MSRYYSDDPVRDFDRWDADQERRRERCHRGRCTHCGEDVYEYDDYYDIEGDLVHSECLVDWAEQYRRGT